MERELCKKVGIMDRYKVNIICRVVGIIVLLFSCAFNVSSNADLMPSGKLSLIKPPIFSLSESISVNPELSRKTTISFEMDENWTPSRQIISQGQNSISRMTSFLLSYNSNLERDHAIEISELYYHESLKEGVNHDIAFSQMCLETGYLKFGGTVNASQNNFCGLGAVDEFTAGDVFESMEVGVRAHIQHLKAYASSSDLNNKLVDKRFRFVVRGSATQIHDLTGKWASDSDYGDKIQNLLDRLYSHVSI